MTRKIALALLSITVGTMIAPAQSPTPVVIQAIVPASAVAPAPVQNAAAPSAGTDAALKALQDMKAANEAILAKQAATLQQLDEMEKSADQIKIYTKRG